VADPKAPILVARDLRAGYEGVEVLHGINLAVEPGSVTVVLGPNGAGKSTLLAVLAGLHEPTHGEVQYQGERVRTNRADKLVRAGLCMIPEGRGVFPNLTVQENLWMMTHQGVSRRDVESRAFERFPQLSGRKNQHAGTLSGGEQQMLAMARAVATEPRVLLLDELSMGLAPLVVEELYRVVGGLASEGITVVVVEQFAEFALSVAKWAAVMAGGRIVHSGPSEEVAASLHELYLGASQSS
jgi:branched-chain amino acid transport system ATP-binding protein